MMHYAVYLAGNLKQNSNFSDMHAYLDREKKQRHTHSFCSTSDSFISLFFPCISPIAVLLRHQRQNYNSRWWSELILADAEAASLSTTLQRQQSQADARGDSFLFG